MNCPKCGNILVMNKNCCERCNEDVVVYKRVMKASNTFYNSGLAKAKVRDLTGAIIDLANSLKLNKKNTKARNLLGLIYYERGEVVDALSEWVLSKHFEPLENEADAYIKDLQANPTKLDNINQTIKKYNSSLLSAKQGNDDLAMIQLKKVVGMNSHFIKAYHLLALLYMKNGEKEKARKILTKVSRIDVNNTTTLRYLKEIGTVTDHAERLTTTGNISHMTDNPSINPISSYKEEKPNIFAFVNLILGVIIGVAVVFFLIVPTIKKNVAEEYNAKRVDYSDEMAAMTVNIATLEGDKQSLQDEIVELKKKIGDIGTGELDIAQYDTLFEAIQLYIENDKTGAAEKLVNMKTDKITSKPAIELYNFMKENTFKTVSLELYNEGHNKYSQGKYEEAVELFESSLKMDEKNTDALYFMGRSYQRLGDNINAAEYYNKIVNDYPDSKRVSETKSRINELD